MNKEVTVLRSLICFKKVSGLTWCLNNGLDSYFEVSDILKIKEKNQLI